MRGARPMAGEARLGRVLITDAELAARVTELGRAIARDYTGENPVIVGVLKAR